MRKGMRKDAMLRWLLTRGARVTRTRDMGGGCIGPVNLPTTNTTSLIGIGYLTEAMVS